MKQYTIQQGDTLLRIAKQFGLSGSKALYMHPSNAAFRQLRPDPNLIYPGDRINIPESQSSVYFGLPDRRHVFVHSGSGAAEKELLRFALKDSDGQLMSGLRATLVTGGQSRKATVSEDGVLEFDLTECAESEGELQVFTAEGSADPSHRFNIQFAHLDPIDTISGIQARCNNLGYDCGTVDDLLGDATRRGIRAFQTAHGLINDGEPGPKTQARLEEAYGC